MNLQAPVDPQALGWEDDGGETGRLRVNVLNGGRLIPKSIVIGASPFGFDQFRYEKAATATIATTQRPLLKREGYNGLITAVTLLPEQNSYAKIKFNIYGRRFGIRWYYASGQPTEPFTVVIDGKSYEVATYATDPLTGAAITVADPFLQWICPDILSSGRHSIELLFMGDVPTGSTRAWILSDILIDSDAGYTPQLPTVTLHRPYTVLNSWDTFSYGSTTPTQPFDATNIRVWKLTAHNYSASPASIYCAHGGGNDGYVFRSAIDVAAGATHTFDFSPYGLVWSPIYLKASAATSFRTFVEASPL